MNFVLSHWLNPPTLQAFAKNPGAPGFPKNSCSTADSRLKTHNRPAVMLWTLDLHGWDVPAASWLELLSEEEHAQYQRFRANKDRLAYAAAHALLRRALSQILKVPPALLVFARDAMGKPFLAAPGNVKIDFSLSHTAGMVAVALSEAGKVGVDIETLDQRIDPLQDLFAFGVSPEEKTHIMALTEPERSKAFIELWTAREAVAKADGRGLSLPFNRIQIDRSGNFATIAADETRPSRKWRLWREYASPAHRLAVAAPENSKLIRMDALMNADRAGVTARDAEPETSSMSSEADDAPSLNRLE